MFPASLFGRVDSRREIPIEANLLSERLKERALALRTLRRRALALVLSVAVAGLLVPTLWGIRGAFRDAAARREAELRKVSARLEALSAEHARSAPRIGAETLSRTMRAHASSLLGQLTLFLNGVPKSVACSSVRAEVLGGVMTATMQADAVDFEGMRQFVSASSDGPGTLSAVLVSTKRSDVLARAGVSFEFVKKVEVGFPAHTLPSGRPGGEN